VSTVLEGRGLKRSYGRVTAVAGVDISVSAGEVMGLIGPNGAGKSTVFELLVGLERPDEGTVFLGGREVTGWPLHRRARAGLGYLAQHPSLFPRLTVHDNLAVALRAVGRSPEDAGELLAGAGLAHLGEQRAGTLSGGERRRVEIARCLALRPRVVLLDEPYSGVDPAHVSALRAGIRDLAGQGVGVLVTDHAAQVVLSTCDRAALLDAGVVLATGSPHELAADPGARQRYLGQEFRL